MCPRHRDHPARAATRATPGPSPSASAACAPACTRWPRCARSRTRSASRPATTRNCIRNLMHGAQYVQDHVVHFYHLHALDWVDVVSALTADPKKTSSLRSRISQLAEVVARLLPRPAEPAQDVRRERPARHLPQRLLGPPGLQAAARSQPDGGGALPRGARLAEGDRQGPHDLRRQEPAPELPGRRRALLDQLNEVHGASTPSGWRWSASSRRRARPSSTRSTSPTCSRSPAFYKDWGGIGGGISSQNASAWLLAPWHVGTTSA